MMTIEQLTEKILKVMESSKASGITLWGGYRDLCSIKDELGGEVIVVAPKHGCTTETCHHISHDPAASTYKWVPPKEVKLVFLGGEMDGDGDYTEWFAAKRGDTVHFLKTWNSRAYHGAARIVDAESVPDWALLALVEGEER